MSGKRISRCANRGLRIQRAGRDGEMSVCVGGVGQFSKKYHLQFRLDNRKMMLVKEELDSRKRRERRMGTNACSGAGLLKRLQRVEAEFVGGKSTVRR